MVVVVVVIVDVVVVAVTSAAVVVVTEEGRLVVVVLPPAVVVPAAPSLHCPNPPLSSQAHFSASHAPVPAQASHVVHGENKHQISCPDTDNITTTIVCQFVVTGAGRQAFAGT